MTVRLSTQDEQTRERAIDGDAAAQFKLARIYRRELEKLPQDGQNEDRLFIANEFHKFLKEAVDNGSEAAKQYVEELIEQDEIPLKRYDGKLFHGFADLAAAGDVDAMGFVGSISNGLRRALANRIQTLEFPKSFEHWPGEQNKFFQSATTPDKIETIKTEVDRISKIFHKVLSEQKSTNKENIALTRHYNKQSLALNEISNGLDVYKDMLSRLQEIEHSSHDL